MSFHFSTSRFRDKARRSTRARILHTTRYKRRWIWRKATIVDLSPEGAKLFGTLRLKVGETVVLELPLVGRRCATIKWISGCHAGCQFSEPIDLVMFDAIVLNSRTRHMRAISRTSSVGSNGAAGSIFRPRSIEAALDIGF